MRIGFVLLLLLGILIPGLAQGEIVLGTLSGSEYEAMNQSSRYAWLQGAVDGMLVEAAFNAASEKNQTTWIGECVRGKSFLQMR
jgi:hypothetical protein